MLRSARTWPSCTSSPQHSDRRPHREALLRIMTQFFCLGGIPTTPDNVKIGLSLLNVRKARPWLRRSLGKQCAFVVDQNKGLEGGRNPHELEGDSRSELHMRDIRRGILAAAVGAGGP